MWAASLTLTLSLARRQNGEKIFVKNSIVLRFEREVTRHQHHWECQNLTSYWLGWELFWGVKVLLGLISVGSEKRRVSVYRFMWLLATLTQSTIKRNISERGKLWDSACTGNNHYSLHHPRAGIQWIMRNKNESLYLNCSRNQASSWFLCRIKRSVISDIISISMTLIKKNILSWLWINNQQSDARIKQLTTISPFWKTLLWLGLC